MKEYEPYFKKTRILNGVANSDTEQFICTPGLVLRSIVLGVL
jgi:hypothetical protein